MALSCTIIPVTAYEQNCSLLVCEETGKAALVDPGGDLDRIDAQVKARGVTIEKILLTHGHMDHCAAADLARKKYGVPIEGPHQADRFWIDKLTESCAMVGFPPAVPFEPNRWLKHGDRVSFGNVELQVFHTPGHTPGHVVFYHPAQRLALVGDVLFQGSVGRTDFPMGDWDQLVDSIRNTLWPLGDDVTFVPGHGPTSTFGEERLTNPFVADERFG